MNARLTIEETAEVFVPDLSVIEKLRDYRNLHKFLGRTYNTISLLNTILFNYDITDGFKLEALDNDNDNTDINLFSDENLIIAARYQVAYVHFYQDIVELDRKCDNIITSLYKNICIISNFYPLLKPKFKDMLTEFRDSIESGDVDLRNLDAEARRVIEKISQAVLDATQDTCSSRVPLIPIFDEANVANTVERWNQRENKRELPLDFIKRVYAKWVGKGLTRSSLRKIDPKLYTALANWARNPKNTIPDDILPDGRRHWDDAKPTDEEIRIYNKINALRRRVR